MPVAYPAAPVDPRAAASSAPAAFSRRSSCSSQIYGFGVKQPYYRVLGPSADATVTPFVTIAGRPADGGRVPPPLRRPAASTSAASWRSTTASTSDLCAERAALGVHRGRATSLCRATSSPTSTSTSSATTTSSSSSTIPTPTSSRASPGCGGPARSDSFELDTDRLPEPAAGRRGRRGRARDPARVHLPPRSSRTRCVGGRVAIDLAALGVCATPATACSAPPAASTGAATGRCAAGCCCRARAGAALDSLPGLADNDASPDGLLGPRRPRTPSSSCAGRSCAATPRPTRSSSRSSSWSGPTASARPTCRTRTAACRSSPTPTCSR